jgi:hypothetical protein
MFVRCIQGNFSNANSIPFLYAHHNFVSLWVVFKFCLITKDAAVNIIIPVSWCTRQSLLHYFSFRGV